MECKGKVEVCSGVEKSERGLKGKVDKVRKERRKVVEGEWQGAEVKREGLRWK